VDLPKKVVMEEDKLRQVAGMNGVQREKNLTS
jgi:hypothetical protein